MTTDTSNDLEDEIGKPYCHLDGTIDDLKVDIKPSAEDGSVCIGFGFDPSPAFFQSTNDGGSILFARDDAGNRFPLRPADEVWLWVYDPPGHMFKSFLLELKNNQNKVRIYFNLDEQTPDGWTYDGEIGTIGVL